MGLKRPAVWLVSPAFGRFAVTRLALAQRAHLATVLAERGIDCHSVIVADDENVEIAREFGCEVVVMTNRNGLGRRFNAGFRHAAQQGADYLVHIGSDDWVHPDLFSPLLSSVLPKPIITGRHIAFVELQTGRLKHATLHGPNGVIPWIIPREVLEPCGFSPIRPERLRGMDGDLVRGLRRAHVRPQWVFHDPHPLARVDFKSDTNLNLYERVPGNGRHDAWVALKERYPSELVELARRTHLDLQEAAMPKLKRPDGRIVSVSKKGEAALLKQGYTSVDAGSTATAPAPSPRDFAFEGGRLASEKPSLDMSRRDLNARAASAGVEEPEKLPNKQAVVDAINATQED